MYDLRALLIAAGATTVCCLCAIWALRSNHISSLFKTKKKACDCECRRGSAKGEKVKEESREKGEMGSEGGSMMEQLVPEITTHALSYLDYTSLCRLSMTNSAMRRAANDDGAWKALYHKDFTVEQDSINPRNGWKAYYAATKAVVSVNAEFFSIIKDRSLPSMSRFWLNADYVKCMHASGEIFMGHSSVINSWAQGFNWGQGGAGQGVGFQIQDVRARVFSEMAWVTMKVFADVDSGPFFVTNVYELHNSKWYMVHHHNSLLLDAPLH